ncbi:MAG: hypothetical protein V4634_17115 [Pseudomonadota bacterium]
MADADFNKNEAVVNQLGENPADELNRKAVYLSTMLSFIYGGGYDNFAAYTQDMQQKYLWACSGLADEILELSLLVVPAEKRMAPGCPTCGAAH